MVKHPGVLGDSVGLLCTWVLPISPTLLPKNIPWGSPTPKLPLSPKPRVSLCFQTFVFLCQLPRLPETVKPSQADTIPWRKAAQMPHVPCSPFPSSASLLSRKSRAGDLWALKGRRSLTWDWLCKASGESCEAQLAWKVFRAAG